jgi:hypothetical protein
MNFNKIKSFVKNIPGKKINERIVVIECDDWGGIRMPSVHAFKEMKDAGLTIGNTRYDQFDTLEDSDDLQALYDVLIRHKDSSNHTATMTAFCNTANPDFEKISTSHFSEYHYEVFSKTYKRYKRSDDIMSVWNEGIQNNIFTPEYHGREHIAVSLWLSTLKSGNVNLLKAFNNQFVALDLEQTPAIAKAFRPNYYIDNWTELSQLAVSLQDGAHIFSDIFGLKPSVFNAPNGIFIKELNEVLSSINLMFTSVPRLRFEIDNNSNAYQKIKYKTGQKNEQGIYFYVRNCNFEPTSSSYHSINHTLEQMQGAFLLYKPAVISTHRVNFVGGLNEQNRTFGLSQLNELLDAILKYWPDVKFLSSKELTYLLS